MATGQLSVKDQIRQLDDARKLVLGNAGYYTQVIQATLPIIGPSALVEFRRWGADFLAEAFATPAIAPSQKETLSLLVLETLKLLLEDPNQDILVLRGVIQAAASIYPLALRWIINNSWDVHTWEHMTAIKTRILRIWDSAPSTIRICCIKFAQRVVLAQTPSANPEPKRGNVLDISLTMIPPEHPILDAPKLEAEASGLLDRMLGTLQDNSSDALIVDATLNTLSILVRNRPATSNRILNTVLIFNPLKHATSPMTPKTKVLVKSMEKTTRMLLMHLSRRNPQNPLTGRISQHIEHLLRMRAEIFDEGSRKRALVEQSNGQDMKRQRTGAALAHPQVEITPLSPGPHTLADIFTFTSNEGLKNFNAGDNIPAPLAAKISVTTIARIDAQLLERAIQGVRDRLAALHAVQQEPINPETTPLDVEDEDDDYEPDYYAAEDTEQILNKLDSSPADERRELEKPVLGGLALPSFRLPPPPILNPDQAAAVGQKSITRVFSTMRTLEDPAVKKAKAGMNRLAASSYDQSSWITVITRIATRSGGILELFLPDEDDEAKGRPRLSDSIREQLFNFVLEDFRKRIDVAVSWLSEEWYDNELQKRAVSSSPYHHEAPANYEKWALRLLDGILPYLHAQDKVLTRFLSELPQLSAAMLSRVKALCRDPSLVNLAITSLYYLVVMRPPVRDIALDAIQDIWTEYEDARPIAAKYLPRWRPAFMEATKQLKLENDEPLGASATPVGAS
ncbi:Transcriptional regulatory protein [Hypoxylon texense]